ncbi:nitroreductase family protein [Fonticella tunisiensis]|uniref:Nitroreductase n=1 Tax=Fonticella tunisiensis TaxID=1096341 RepID=A0A4R7KBB4_9CLOT|nr:nitroreductase family protein [Fonticella tunisiensis]TDT50370.1 nitroreductase [Fonticella tunisiensis]
MDFLELLKKRHSVRSYRPDKVEEEKLMKILEAGRLAPTAANKQAFKIVVIHTEGHEDELRRIYNRDWFVKAPIILGICTIPEKAWVRSDGKNYGDVDVSIVMDHMILEATALGLGTCWIGAFDKQAAIEVLKLGANLEPVAFTPLGYAREQNFIKYRKDLDEIVIYR